MSTILAKKARTATLEQQTPINTLQQMWDATIGYQQDGIFDTDAMRKVYRVMSPKLTFQDIANVFSGVYADTYWNISLMDPSVLSKSMQSALALSQPLADKYSQTAVLQWRGILCRKNINDTGRIPASDFTSSIDIICNQNTELDPIDLIENWNSEYWQTPQVGKNYVYTRCQNIAFRGSINPPAVQMFYTTGGFNQPPTSWIKLYTVRDGSVSDGKVILIDGTSGPIEDGIRGASEGFFFNLTSTDHVCVIATIQTDFFANPTDVSNGNWDSQKWISHNGAAAWHNVNPQLNLEEKLVFYNQDSTPEEFSFLANCRNVPVGSKIGFKSADPKFPFNSGLIEVINSSQQIEHQLTIPPYYKGQVIVTMESPKGDLLPKQAAVEVNMVWRLKHGNKHYTKAVKQLGAFDKAIHGEELSLNLGSYTFEGSKPEISKN